MNVRIGLSFSSILFPEWPSAEDGKTLIRRPVLLLFCHRQHLTAFDLCQPYTALCFAVRACVKVPNRKVPVPLGAIE
jgi:hypothetical protein